MNVKKIGILYRSNPTTPMEILPKHIESIRKTLPGVEVAQCETEDEMIKFGSDCEVLLTSPLITPHNFYRAATGLKWVQGILAGVDGFLVPELRDRRIIVTATKGIHGLPMAEHTLAMILGFSRGLHVLRDQQHNKLWKKYPTPSEIRGTTVGMIGLGAIGREIARTCKLMGMKVLATKRTPVNDELVDRFYPIDKLEELMRESDYVVVIIPSTPETRHIIGESQLRAMKTSAILINVSRGQVVDEAALTRALKEGWIAGAGLDVFEIEPLPQESELWGMSNVVLTPHMAAISPYYMDRAIAVFCDNLQRFARGERLLYEVDWEGGY